MLERTVVVGPFQCNCRIWVCPRTGRAVISDPGDEPSKILEAWRELSAECQAKGIPHPRVDALFHTHAHLDHIGGTRGVWEALALEDPSSTPSILLHKDDEFLYRILKKQGELFGFEYDEPLDLTRFLTDGETLHVGELSFEIRHTPGHSPGSICLAGSGKALTGDTLFRGSVGRTDLWGADGDTMFRSIRERILTLPEETVVCPGHGPDSTVEREKRKNPFLA